MNTLHTYLESGGSMDLGHTVCPTTIIPGMRLTVLSVCHCDISLCVDTGGQELEYY